MSYIFIFLALVIAVLDWIAVARKWQKVEYFAKPATMLALLAWLGVNGGFQGPMSWFALGLLFSLGGDVFLMLPHEQFIPGLVSFLIGHICYLIGFNSTGVVIDAASLILLVVVLFTGYRVYQRVAAGLQAQRQQQSQAAGPGLFHRDQFDAILGPYHFDPLRLADFRGCVRQQRRPVVFHFRQHAGFK